MDKYYDLGGGSKLVAEAKQHEIARHNDQIKQQKDSAMKERAELRDRFAIAALQGIMSSWNGENKKKRDVLKVFSTAAYRIADAMLEAREVNNG